MGTHAIKLNKIKIKLKIKKKIYKKPIIFFIINTNYLGTNVTLTFYLIICNICL